MVSDARIDDALRALSSPVRRQILLEVRRGERTAGEIAAGFSLTRPAVSQHLQVLKQAGLLEERRQGTRRLYRMRPEPLREVAALVAELCGGAALPEAPQSPEPTGFVRQEVSLGARPEAAFALLIEPSRLGRWWGRPERFEAMPGGALALAFPGRRLEGEVRALEPDGRLTLHLDGVEVVFLLEPDGVGARLRVEQTPGGEGPLSAEGWSHYLERLEALCRGWDPGADDFGGSGPAGSP